MAPFAKSDFIWLNGELVRWADATINVSAHGLQYGTGVFEGMRCYETPDGPAIFRLDAHIRRLFLSASFYEIGIPFDFNQLCAASLEVVRANGLTNAYLRPLAFFDSYSFAVWPKDCPVTVAIIAVPGQAVLPGRIRTAACARPCRPWRASIRRRCRRSSRRAATTRTPSAPCRRPSAAATTTRFCSTPRATSPRDRARTCSSCATAR